MVRDSARPMSMLLLVWLAGLWLAAAHATPLQGDPVSTPLLLTNTTGEFRAGLHLDYFADQDRRCDIGCALARFGSTDLAAVQTIAHSDVDTPNLGLTGSFWFRLVLENRTPHTDWVAEADVPYLDDVQLFVLRANGVLARQHSGDMMPTRERPLWNRNIALPLTLAQNERITLFMRVTNEGPVTLPLGIKTRSAFDVETAEENLAYGLYFGILIAVVLYNLMLFLILRDRNHLLYVLYVSSFGMAMATVFGFSALYFWPENPWWINRSVPFSILVTGIFVMLFARSFLALPKDSAGDRVMIASLLWLIVLFPVALFAPFAIAVRVIYITAMLLILWLLGIGIQQVAAGNLSARYFMIAWVVLMLSVLAFLLTKLGVFPSIALTEYGILVGSALEAILLSIALAHRFVVIRNESMRIQTAAKAELEQRVEERTRALDQALRTRSEFLATVSHEIRTPMNGVLGITELLADTELTPRQREYAQIIQSSGRTLLAIINDVLDYSKIEAGKMSLERVPFRLRDVLRNTVQIFQAEAERKKLAFLTHIDPDVPDEITGDPVRLQQVINNLLSNAIKFTDEGSVSLSVHREQDGKLTFTVTDSGIGIDTRIQPRLFESFNQGDNSMTRRFGGSGLGLTISRRLIELMGGTISFESDLGRGTTFFFTIPVRTGSTGSHPRIETAGTVATRPMKLLVVDDNEINLQVAAGLLAKLGHDVQTVSNAEDALSLLFAAENSTPGNVCDAVLMDCEMPGMDGFSATREIRAREKAGNLPRMPVIALTAHAFAEKVEACRAAGMDDHLAKPLNLRILSQTLARAVRPSSA